MDPGFSGGAKAFRDRTSQGVIKEREKESGEEDGRDDAIDMWDLHKLCLMCVSPPSMVNEDLDLSAPDFK